MRSLDKRTRIRLKNWIGAVLAPFVLLGLLRSFEYRQVFQPSRDFILDAKDLSPWVEEVSIATEDGLTLNAWYFPALKTSSEAPWAILVSHGNAGNISHRLELYEILEQTGAAILAYDYRGYGRSEGRPSEAGVYKDIEAAYQWLRSQGFTPDRMILHGTSLGAAPSVHLAASAPVGGLVIRSAFTSVPDLGRELFPFLPVRLVGKIQFDNQARLPEVSCPTLILHGREDTMIGFHHAEANFKAATEPKRLYDFLPGDHNESAQSVADPYIQAILQLMEASASSGR